MEITTKEVVRALAEAAFMVIVFGNVIAKAGYSRWYSVLLGIPFVNLIAVIWFAFSEWPIEEQLLKAQFEASRLDRR